jgi:hypothetical protein
MIIVSLPSTETMKPILIIIIGILLWQSADTRQFASNVLQGASDFIEPNKQHNINLSF